MTRARALLVVGATVVAVVLVVGFSSEASEQHRLDRARRAASLQHRRLDSTRAAVAKEERALQAAYDVGLTLTRDLVDANADVTVTQNDVMAAIRTLETARLSLGTQTNRRANVEQCLIGVRRALDATSRKQTAAATLYLKDAAPRCLSALESSGEASPVLAYDFPDPFVLRVGGEYFAYATNAAGGAVQEARSPDLLHWNLADDALANLPSWARPGATWAPAVLQRPAASVMYYTVTEASTLRQCLSVAIGASPGGPFLDPSSKPLECGEFGAIDPSPFVDANGAAYLLYKTERPQRIWSRLLTPDGRAFAGPARLMLVATQRWEAGSVEAPSMLRRASAYWLFYSGNDWNGPSYGEGVARCAGPTGPCTASGANPILASHGSLAGPGGGSVFTDSEGSWWLAYHAYQQPLVRYPNSRLLYLSRVGFSADGTPGVIP